VFAAIIKINIAMDIPQPDAMSTTQEITQNTSDLILFIKKKTLIQWICRSGTI
jgi:hypothetical protein